MLALLATLACVFYGGTRRGRAVDLHVVRLRPAGAGAAAGPSRAVAGCIVCYVIFSATGHVDMTDFLSNLLPVLFIGFAMIGLRRQFQLTAELATRARGGGAARGQRGAAPSRP